MAYDIGTARGIIELEYNGRGIDEAKRDLADLESKGKTTGYSAEQIGKGFTRAGLAVAAGLGAGVMAAANFEQRLSAIKAVSGATSGEMDKISAKALQLGKDTAFSAGESALAMEELIKAGLSVDDVLNGAADATVNLAAAGEIDLPQAATIASNAMNQFNLSARDMPKVADAIAGAANASAIDVGEFGQSLQQVGAVANLAGVSFEDTATAIAIMGNAGIKGSDAGTSLKSMFMRLQPTTQKQIDQFKELGLITEDGTNRFYDQAGNLKSLAQVSELLGGSLKGMTKEQKQAALVTMFGSDAIRAAAILSKEGAKGFDEMATSMGKVSAADVAAERLNNFKGSLEQLKGSLETAGIVIGQVLLPYLRQLVDGVTAAFNAFLNLDEGTQRMIVIAAAVAAGFFLIVGAIVKIVAVGKTLHATFVALRAVMATTWIAALGPIALVIAAVVAIGAALFVLYQKSETFRNFINGMWASIQAAAQAVVAWFQTSVVPIFQQVWTSIQAGVTAFLAWWSTAWGMIKTIVTNVWNTIAPAVMAAWALVVAAVQAGINIVKAIFTAGWNVLVAVVTTVWNVIKGVVEGAIKVIGAVILAVLSVLRGDWSAAWDYIKQALNAAWEAMIKVVGAAIKGLASIVKAGWDGIKNVTSVVWDAIKALLNAAWNAIKAAMTAAWNALKAVTTSVWNGIKQFLSTLWDSIKQVVSAAVSAVKTAVSTAWDAIKSATSTAWNAIKSAISDAWNGIKTLVSTAVSNVKSAISDGWNAAKTATSNAWNNIKSAVQNGIASMMGFIRAIPGQITGALSGLASTMAGIGRDMIAGLIGGIRDMASAAIGAVQDVVGGAVNAVTGFLEIGSPSKLFFKFGQWLDQGFIDGVKSGRDGVKGAFTDILKALKKESDETLHALLTSSKAKLMDLATEYGKIEKQLEKAVDKVKSLRDEANTLRKSVIDSIRETGNLGNIEPETDAEGNQLPLTYEAIKNELEAAKQRAVEFSKVLAELKKMGLNKEAIQQLVTAGPEAGLEAAKAILANGKIAVNEINVLQRALANAGREVGKLAADNMFKAAIDAAQAVVKGLKGKQDKIFKESMRIGLDMARGIKQGLANMAGEVAAQAEAIAEAAMATIRRALRSRSPSKRTMEAGEDAGLGFAIGLRNMLRAVEAAARTMGQAAIPVVATPSVGVVPTRIPTGDGSNTPITPNFDVRVFLGDTELKDMVRVEIGDTLQPLSRIVRQGAV